MAEFDDLKKEIADIKARNERVEREKAWETSLTRKISVIVVTYICACIVMFVLNISDPFANAVIPTLGFFLSAQSLPFIKKIWLKKHETN